MNICSVFKEEISWFTDCKTPSTDTFVLFSPSLHISFSSESEKICEISAGTFPGSARALLSAVTVQISRAAERSAPSESIASVVPAGNETKQSAVNSVAARSGDTSRKPTAHTRAEGSSRNHGKSNSEAVNHDGPGILKPFLRTGGGGGGDSPMIPGQRQENVCAHEQRRATVLGGICRFPGEGGNSVEVSRQYVETSPEDSSVAGKFFRSGPTGSLPVLRIPTALSCRATSPCGKTQFGTRQIFATVTSGADNAAPAESAREGVSA